MKNFRTCALMVALFAGLALLAACEKKGPPPPPLVPAPHVEAPAPLPIETPVAASSEQAEQTPTAPAAPPATTPAASAEPQAAVSFPAECESYLARMNECAEKLSDNPSASDALKKQVERTRASWAQVSNPDALGAICKQAAGAFEQRAKEMGC
ncbi:MAG: hypothetical protein LBE32_02565 [Burkholderiales bacterium]|nr:hypothetical protein [Burkholderiales bacterium]